MKYSLIIVFCLLCSCQNSPGDKNTGEEQLSQNELDVVSKSICPEGKELVLLESDNISIDGLKPAIAFVSGSKFCALEKNIYDQWWNPFGNKLFFEVQISTCIPNNSIWKFKSGHTMDGEMFYKYINALENREISINGTKDINATYARDHAGIRPLACQ